MRKNLHIRIALFILLFSSGIFQSIAQDALKYKYPILPGTSEWENFKSTTEMIDACNIPDDVLASLSTKELWDICLQYPLMRQYTASNSPYRGIEGIIGTFNGLSELMRREDAHKVIYSYYLTEKVANINNTKNKGAYTFDFCAVELILAQKPIISRFSREEQLNVLTTMLEKYDEKSSYSEYFGMFGKVTSAFVANKYAEATGKTKRAENEQFRLFTEEMLLADASHVDTILSELIEYKKSIK
jgi:hypothetical protein